MGEVLEQGPEPRRWRPPRWLSALVAVVLLGAAGLVAHLHSTGSDRDTASRSARPDEPVIAVGSGSPTSTRLGHPLLPGAAPGWEVFGRIDGGIDSDDAVVRLRLARGEITITSVPNLHATDRVSFVAGPRQVLVRSLHAGPGYRVPDGKPPRELSGTLAHAGPLIPGPDADQVWVPSSHGRPRMLLVDLDGHRTGVSVQPLGSVPPLASAVSDGAGGFLYRTVHGFYDMRPSGLRHPVRGVILAVGPTSRLTRVCPHRRQCSLQVINTRTGAHDDLGRLPRSEIFGLLGAISPDGDTAALVLEDADGSQTVHLLDLESGRDHATGVSVPNPRLFGGGLAWSPDSRWLFTINAAGNLTALDSRTGDVRSLAPGLPSITQLAVRAGSTSR